MIGEIDVAVEKVFTLKLKLTQAQLVEFNDDIERWVEQGEYSPTTFEFARMLSDLERQGDNTVAKIDKISAHARGRRFQDPAPVNVTVVNPPSEAEYREPVEDTTPKDLPRAHPFAKSAVEVQGRLNRI